MKRLGSWLVATALALSVTSAFAGSTGRALKDLVDGAKASQSDTLLVLHDGKKLVDYHRPGASNEPIDMMSSTKSLVGLAVGRLITQGKLKSIDEPVYDFYPEWKQGNKAKITVRMLLNHTSGLQNVGSANVEIYPAPDAFQLALAAELSDPPGTKFSYNNKAMNLIAGVIEKAAGEPMDVYIAKEILTPMGIQPAPWGETDKAGHPLAMAGWQAMPEEAAKIGQLVLDDGRWNGKQLIDAQYIHEMVGQSTPLTKSYGLLWWRHPLEVRLNPAKIEQLRSAGFDTAFVDKLQVLAKSTYGSTDELYGKGIPAAGLDMATLIGQFEAHGKKLSDVAEPSPIVSWEANGYLGNYIVIIPKAHLVAVRQIAEPHDFDGSKPWPYGYEDFGHRVAVLGQTYTKDLAVDQL